MLKTAIEMFDGRDTAALGLAAKAATQADAPDLMDWAGHVGRPPEAATWVIKAMVETGRSQGFDAPRLISIGKATDQWPVALHLLQLAQHWPAMADRAFAQTHLYHVKPMVRTWALDTYVRACVAEGAFDLAQTELARVLEQGKPSEKARARALSLVLNRSGRKPI